MFLNYTALWLNLLLVASVCFAYVAIALELWAFRLQEKEIRDQQSGRSISIAYYAGWFALYATLAIYAWAKPGHDWPLTVHATCCGVCQIPLMRGLFKHKKLLKFEKWFLGYLALLVTVAALAPNNQKGWFLLTAQLTHGICNIFQPLEMRHEDHTGAVHFQTVKLLKITAGFWAVYNLLRLNLAALPGSIGSVAYQVWYVEYMDHIHAKSNGTAGKPANWCMRQTLHFFDFLAKHRFLRA